MSLKELHWNDAKKGVCVSRGGGMFIPDHMDAAEERARERQNIFIILKLMRLSDLIYKKRIFQI